MKDNINCQLYNLIFNIKRQQKKNVILYIIQSRLIKNNTFEYILQFILNKFKRKMLYYIIF